MASFTAGYGANAAEIAQRQAAAEAAQQDAARRAQERAQAERMSLVTSQANQYAMDQAAKAARSGPPGAGEFGDGLGDISPSKGNQQRGRPGQPSGSHIGAGPLASAGAAAAACTANPLGCAVVLYGAYLLAENAPEISEAVAEAVDKAIWRASHWWDTSKGTTEDNPVNEKEALETMLGRPPTAEELEAYREQLRSEGLYGEEAATRADRADGKIKGGHRKKKQRSKEEKHQGGRARAKRDQNNEKGDTRRRY